MVEIVANIDAILYKFRILLVGIIFTSCLVVVALFMAGLQGSACFANHTSDSNVSSSYGLGGSEDANAVSAGMFSAADSIGHSLNSASNSISCSGRATTATLSRGTTAVGSALAGAGSATAHELGRGVHGIGHGLHGTAVFVVMLASNSASFIAGTMSSTTNALWHVTPLATMVRPSRHTAVPVIDSGSPLPLYAASALPAAQTISQPTTAPSAPTPVQWPLHGTITTEFGVPEPPYQPIHTGIDISDGQRSPIHPYKIGRVVDVIHSGSGLGNHIVIDHGDGITSVYGHLYSTAVVVGQQVNLDTVLGYEGSTGVSTGTHLHFEIHVNGTPNNPHHFITGQP